MKNYCGKHTLVERNIIKTHYMSIECNVCHREFHFGEFLVVLSDEEQSNLKILCRDVYCNCGEHHRGVPVIFRTQARAVKESKFCEGRPLVEGLDWRSFWEIAAALQTRN
jgi:hypothetical protein